MDFNSLIPDELVDSMLARLDAVSGGQMADLSVHSPVRVIFESVVLALVEYGYRVNQLPDAMLVRLLELSGMVVSQGNKATVTITLEFVAPLASNLTVPTGTEFYSNDGITFVTTEPHIISIGSSSGSVGAVALEVGSQYNVPSRTLTNISTTVSTGLLSAIYNDSPATGGSDPANLSEATQVAGTYLSEKQSLVTATDFIIATLQLLPDGSRVTPIANLNANSDGYTTFPSVHTKILKPDLTPLTPTEITNIQSTIEPRVIIGTTVYISDCEIMPVDVKVNVRLEPNANPGEVFSDIREKMQRYINPLTWKASRSLMYKELERVAGDSIYVDYIQGAYIKLPEADIYETANIAMPNDWTFPKMELFILDMTTNTGVTYSYGYGLFDDEPETPIL